MLIRQCYNYFIDMVETRANWGKYFMLSLFAQVGSGFTINAYIQKSSNYHHTLKNFFLFHKLKSRYNIG